MYYSLNFLSHLTLLPHQCLHKFRDYGDRVLNSKLHTFHTHSSKHGVSIMMLHRENYH
jgi:hypothetical protein